MKKRILITFPLVALSFLSSCGTQSVRCFKITFDSVKGIFDSGASTFTLEVKEGTEIKKIIDAIKEPTWIVAMPFAYYTYSDGKTLNYKDSVKSDITLKAKYLDAEYIQNLNLNRLPWEVIKGICTGGNITKWFQIGATKDVEINNVIHPVRIIGTSHDKITNLNQMAGLTFEFVNVISAKDSPNNVAACTKWNDSRDNYNFPGSTFNKTIANVYNSLPDDLKVVIPKVDKKVGCGSQYDIKTYSTNLFPLSPEEMGIDTWDCPQGEGTKYSYYDGEPSYKKSIVDGGSESYWLRSPYLYFEELAIYIDDNGSNNQNYVVTPFAFSPAFCI